jgi:hypothetical protein
VTLSVKKVDLKSWFENQENESKSSKLDSLVMETGLGERETVYINIGLSEKVTKRFYSSSPPSHVADADVSDGQISWGGIRNTFFCL